MRTATIWWFFAGISKSEFLNTKTHRTQRRRPRSVFLCVLCVFVLRNSCRSQRKKSPAADSPGCRPSPKVAVRRDKTYYSRYLVYGNGLYRQGENFFVATRKALKALLVEPSYNWESRMVRRRPQPRHFCRLFKRSHPFNVLFVTIVLESTFHCTVDGGAVRAQGHVSVCVCACQTG